MDCRSMLILTCVDGALWDVRTGSCAPAREVLASLTAIGVPVVLTSHHSAGELTALERELGLSEPFIAEGGRRLYVPVGYFGRTSPVDTREWEVFEFSPPSIEDAIETLTHLCRMSGDVPLLVGVGTSWADSALLRHVDVPVVVRNDQFDQHRLRSHFPDAYVTASTGLGGWREAILGVRAADADDLLDVATG